MQRIQIAYLLVFLLSVLRAVSQFCFKLASGWSSADQPLATFGRPTIWVGTFIYIISFPLLLQIHKLLPLSRAAPLLMSIPQVWTALLGIFLLSELLDLYRVTGIGLILAGTIVIGGAQE